MDNFFAFLFGTSIETLITDFLDGIFTAILNGLAGVLGVDPIR